MTLKRARELPEEFARKVHEGTDPIDERQADKRAKRDAAMVTIRAMCEAWMDERTSWTPAYREDVAGAFERHVYGRIGSIPFADITPGQLKRLVFDPLVAQGRQENGAAHPSAARHGLERGAHHGPGHVAMRHCH